MLLLSPASSPQWWFAPWLPLTPFSVSLSNVSVPEGVDAYHALQRSSWQGFYQSCFCMFLVRCLCSLHATVILRHDCAHVAVFLDCTQKKLFWSASFFFWGKFRFSANEVALKPFPIRLIHIWDVNIHWDWCISKRRNIRTKHAHPLALTSNRVYFLLRRKMIFLGFQWISQSFMSDFTVSWSYLWW